MKRNIITVLLIALTMIVGQTIANNITIDSNPQPVNEDPANKYMDIQFDISWDNSWRTDTATLTPDWWDAAWVFVKYKIGDDGTWKHCHLSATAGHHSITTDNGVAGTIEPVADSMGVFMYRSSGGTGSNDWDDVQLRWYYGSEPDVGTDYIEFKVFALEMVYVPEGAFYVGDGAGSSTIGAMGRLHPVGDTNSAYHITSEAGFNLGGTTNGNLTYNDKDNIAGRPDTADFDKDNEKSLSNDFPKGYNAFYCMKHELPQIGYVDFLNTLTRTQQNRNTGTDISGTSITNRYVMSNTDTVKERNAIKCDATLPGSGTIKFYCDLDEDDNYNESNDGQTIACNFLDGYDISAYSDWAGLRWMTELEYEKACRGPLEAVPNELSWGNSSYVEITDIVNVGEETEVSNTENANYNAGNTTLGQNEYQPIRTGIFATSTTAGDRDSANASYYGILDLSGNLREPCITIGKPEGRVFDGIHGDGLLTSAGYDNVINWPSSPNSIGSSARGGSFEMPYEFGRVANRYQGERYLYYRRPDNAIRLVRSSPEYND